MSRAVLEQALRSLSRRDPLDEMNEGNRARAAVEQALSNARMKQAQQMDLIRTQQRTQPRQLTQGRSSAPSGRTFTSAAQPDPRVLQNDRIQSQERMQASELANRLAQQSARTQGQKELNQQNSDLEEARRKAALDRALAVVNASRGGQGAIKV